MSNTADPPPPYSLFPVICTPIGEKKPEDDKAIKPPSTKSQSVKFSVFNTNARLHSKPNDTLQSFGTLYVGLKTVTDINKHAIFFKPFDENDNAELCDISHTVSVVPTDDSSIVKYRKIPDNRSQYSFEISIAHLGGGKASWKKGTFSLAGQDWDWSGSFSSFEDRELDVAIIDVPKPDGFDNLPDSKKGSPAELDEITPIAHVGDGGMVKQGDDAAQIYGDETLQTIMMHALDDDTKKTLLPNLPLLGAQETMILNQNKDFFERGAVHLLAERLKKDEKIDPEIAKHIFYRWEFYMKMVSNTEVVPDNEIDPAELYGLDRKKDKDLISKLQMQFRTASMACYELGYLKQCQQWSRYTTFPKYWFDVYQQILLSEEHITQWLAHTASTMEYSDARAIPGKDLVMIWSNKLSLLKHAAESQGVDPLQMNIDHVADTLLGRLQQHVAYSQLLNDDFIAEVLKILQIMEKTKTSKDFDDRFKALTQTAKDSRDALISSMPHILTMLANPSEEVGQLMQSFWDKRFPKPQGQPVAIEMKNMSVGQVAEALEDAAITETSLTQKLKNVDVKGMLKKAGLAVAGGLKTMIKFAIHGAALFSFYSFLSGDKSPLSVSEMGNAICAIAAEGLSLFGGLIQKLLQFRRIFTWAMARGAVVKTATAWFANSIKAGTGLVAKSFHALFGGVAKLIRVVGLVGCIFNLITSYWGMQYVGAGAGDDDAARYRIYSTIQFALGVVEGVAIVGGIVSEIIGFALGSMICGPLALIVGVIALIVLVVYLIWFAPDPFKDIKTFLNNLGRKLGSYNPDKTESEPVFITWGESEKIQDAAKKLNIKSTHDLDNQPERVPPPRRVTALQAAAAVDVRMALRHFIFAIGVFNNPLPLVQVFRNALASLDELFFGNLYFPAVARFQQGWVTFLATYNQVAGPMRFAVGFVNLEVQAMIRLTDALDELAARLAVDQ